MNKCGFPDLIVRKEACPNCDRGTKWVSKYGGNDPDVWPAPCEHCDATGIVDVEYEPEESE